MQVPTYYEFFCPVKTVAGKNVLERIPDLLSELRAEKPMVITDKGVVAAGLVDIVTNAVEGKLDIGSVEDGVPTDSDLKVVNSLAAKYQKLGCDSIIAVGGGSVLDTAKGINIIVSEESDDLMKFTGSGALKRKLKPLLAIPTTAGTGSEVTAAAVIADHEKNRKMLFASGFLLPDVAVIDARMTMTLPPFLTSQTAMDAFTHSVEAYTCLSKNPLSDTYALEAISRITANVVNVVKNPDDHEGRLNLAIASTLAGIAFSNSTVGLVHTLGHSIGAVLHVPHGTCMAILLPYGLEYNMHKIEPYAAELLWAIAGEDVYAKTDPAERADKTVDYIRKLNNDLCAATSGRHYTNLKDIMDRDGKQVVSLDSLNEVARVALGDGSIFYNPEDLDYEDCLMILEAAYYGVKLDRSLIKKG